HRRRVRPLRRAQCPVARPRRRRRRPTSRFFASKALRAISDAAPSSRARERRPRAPTRDPSPTTRPRLQARRTRTARRQSAGRPAPPQSDPRAPREGPPPLLLLDSGRAGARSTGREKCRGKRCDPTTRLRRVQPSIVLAGIRSATRPYLHQLLVGFRSATRPYL